MANIRTQDAPSDLGLRPDDRAQESLVNSGRRIAALYDTAADATNSIGRTAKSTIEDVGNVVVKHMDHEQIATGAAHGTMMFDSLSQSKDVAIKGIDPNDPSYGQKVEVALKQWRENQLEPALEKFSSGFTTENSQAWAEHFIDKTRNQMFADTARDISTAAGIGVKNSMSTAVNAASNAALREPWSVDTQLSLIEHSITGAVSSSNVKGIEGAKLQSDLLADARKQIVQSAAVGAVQKSNDPEKTAQEFIAKYPEYIDGKGAIALANNARTQIRAQRVEENYALQTQKMQKQDVSDQREGQYLVKLHSDDPKDRASVSPKAIANDFDLSREARERMISMVDRQTKPETDAQTSRKTSVELFTWMRQQENLDPAKMKNRIDDAYSAGNLTWGDRNNLIKEVEDRKTPEGLALAQDRGQFFKQYSATIVTGAVGMNGKPEYYDPQVGSPRLYQADRDARRVEADLKSKGLDPHLAYDPSSEYFLGKPSNLQKWRGSMQADLDTKASAVVPAEKAGDTGPPPSLRGIASLSYSPTRQLYRDDTTGKMYRKDGTEVGK